jgi:hypothetical protein
MHPKSQFGKDRNSANGFAYACKQAVAQRNRSAHQKARKVNNARHAKLRLERKASADARMWAIKKLVSEASRRAKAKGLAFDISIDRLHAPERCPIFGVNLVYQADKQRLPNSASLDRIDNNKGYTHDNVWIISWRANQIKTDAAPHELRAVAAAVEARVGKKRAGRLLDGVEHSAIPARPGQ